MPQTSDGSPSATEITQQQKARLRFIREFKEPVQANAARRADVSVESWNRMEVGATEIKAVALAKFCLSYDVPAEWVITGRLEGLSADALEAVVHGVPHLIARSRGGSAELSSPGPGHTNERAGTRGKRRARVE